MPYRTIIEPFRIRSVEPLRFTTRGQREVALRSAGWNLFNLPSEAVIIDLLTDSGTGAMSTEQWAALMRGDESYAGSASFERFEGVVRDLTGFRHVIPTHQGRAAESILFSSSVRPGDVVPNNTHFDTTRANVEYQDAEARDVLCVEGHNLQLDAPFKGNLDIDALEAAFAEVGSDRIPLVMVTVTNNAGGGQPVSMANLGAVREVCDRYDIQVSPLGEQPLAEVEARTKRRTIVAPVWSGETHPGRVLLVTSFTPLDRTPERVEGVRRSLREARRRNLAGDGPSLVYVSLGIGMGSRSAAFDHAEATIAMLRKELRNHYPTVNAVGLVSASKQELLAHHAAALFLDGWPVIKREPRYPLPAGIPVIDIGLLQAQQNEQHETALGIEKQTMDGAVARSLGIDVPEKQRLERAFRRQ